MRLSILLILIAVIPPAMADTELEDQINNSYLALSAFECSDLAPDDEEAERLFLLGLNAGRQFLAYRGLNWDTYIDLIAPKVSDLWNLTSGPSDDFILGQIYLQVFNERAMFEGVTTLEEIELWDLARSDRYRDKNCSFLGK